MTGTAVAARPGSQDLGLGVGVAALTLHAFPESGLTGHTLSEHRYLLDTQLH